MSTPKQVRKPLDSSIFFSLFAWFRSISSTFRSLRGLAGLRAAAALVGPGAQL